MAKPCLVPTLAEDRASAAVRVRRATDAGILGNRRLAFLRATANDTAKDERADLLTTAADGCLKAQVRCLNLYGKGWQWMAADLASKREQREDSKS